MVDSFHLTLPALGMQSVGEQHASANISCRDPLDDLMKEINYRACAVMFPGWDRVDALN
ncbi:hypothetical protein [Azotobacter beijerinckii]|uniref:hypothetical protein n=1 Tax=Azotobacter beijerinckii TaxID=170623 RepID=UPI001428A305|nr:hypothetical protein [Azotobacter beijerinckii]